MDNSNNTTTNQPIQPGQAPERDDGLKIVIIIIAVIGGFAGLMMLFFITSIINLAMEWTPSYEDSRTYTIEGKSPAQYMLDYGSKRYGDDCLYAHDDEESIDSVPSYFNNTSTNISFYVTCKAIGDDEEVYVKGIRLDQDSRQIYDDYLTAKYLPETKEYFQNVVTEIGLNDRTIVDVKRASLDEFISLDAKATFDDLLKQKGCHFEASYFIPTSTAPTYPELEAFKKYFPRNVESYSVSVYLVNDDVLNDRTKWSTSSNNMYKLFTIVNDEVEPNNS